MYDTLIALTPSGRELSLCFQEKRGRKRKKNVFFGGVTNGRWCVFHERARRWMMRVTSRRSLVEGSSMGVRETAFFYIIPWVGPGMQYTARRGGANAQLPLISPAGCFPYTKHRPTRRAPRILLVMLTQENLFLPLSLSLSESHRRCSCCWHAPYASIS